MTVTDQHAVDALAALFSTAYDDAVALARAVLDRPPSPTARVRAMTALIGALTCTDRGPEAIGSAQHLLNDLDRHPVSSSCERLARAMVGLTQLVFGARSTGHDWPLLVGLRRYLTGDLAGALAPLRTAYERQGPDAGLFRSETTAALVVVLAELGQPSEARRLLTERPPDRIAMLPGLLAWSAAAVAAAEGHRNEAGDLAAHAARLAAARGAPGVAMTFLVDAARWGDARQAARVLGDLVPAPRSEPQRVRAADVVARASGSAERLVEAAEIQLAAGFRRHALELAGLATTADRDSRYGRRISVVRRHAGLSRPATPAGTLTDREHEVARLAAHGLSDRLIAEQLVVSIRTVQSHLASSYRKLGIRSRGELAQIS